MSRLKVWFFNLIGHVPVWTAPCPFCGYKCSDGRVMMAHMNAQGTNRHQLTSMDSGKYRMAKLIKGVRDMLAASKFGLPKPRKYPMPDRAHAANAKARATQMVNKGKLSPSSAAKIRAKANRVLGK